MSLTEVRATPERKTFDGARLLRRLIAVWPGLYAEVSTVAIGAAPARSDLCVPTHALLGMIQGGAQPVTVKADGAATWRGPKRPGAAGFFPAERLMVSLWPVAAEMTYLALFIAPRATDELLGRNTGIAVWRTRAEAGDPFLSAALARLAQALSRAESDPLAPLIAETLATAVHLHAAERFSDLRAAEGGADDGVERALDLILDELPRAVPLARMVAVSGLPRGRFLAAFRRRAGVSPHQFILHERLTRARALLETTRRPVGEVAQAVGCANAGHLTQLFRKHLDTTPRAWRHQRGRF